MTPEGNRGVGALGRCFVERKDSGEQTSLARQIGQPELILFVARSQDEMFAVMPAAAGTQARPIGRRECERGGLA